MQSYGPYLLPYGTSTTIYFPITNTGATGLLSTVTFTAGDILIATDASLTSSTNLPTHVGNGLYSLDITAAELTGSFVSVIGDDATIAQWADFVLSIQTTNNASAGVPQVADSYVADISLTIDDDNSKDVWTVSWYKNGQLVTSGITNAAIRAYDTGGSDLWAGSPISMTQIGSTGSYYLERTTTNRITDGTKYLAVATATIGGSTRTAARGISRDANS